MVVPQNRSCRVENHGNSYETMDDLGVAALQETSICFLMLDPRLVQLARLVGDHASEDRGEFSRAGGINGKMWV